VSLHDDVAELLTMHAQLNELKRVRADDIGLGHDPECPDDLALTTIVRAYNKLYWRRIYEVAREIGE
jgi:ABC-type anion transport system duplicated permease subunit